MVGFRLDVETETPAVSCCARCWCIETRYVDRSINHGWFWKTWGKALVPIFIGSRILVQLGCDWLGMGRTMFVFPCRTKYTVLHENLSFSILLFSLQQWGCVTCHCNHIETVKIYFFCIFVAKESYTRQWSTSYGQGHTQISQRPERCYVTALSGEDGRPCIISVSVIMDGPMPLASSYTTGTNKNQVGPKCLNFRRLVCIFFFSGLSVHRPGGRFAAGFEISGRSVFIQCG